MKRHTLFAALALTGCSMLASSTASAGGSYSTDQCDIDSNYEFKLNQGNYLFTRDNGAPKSIEFRRDAVLIDGRMVNWSPADRAKLAQLHERMRAMQPEIKAIAMEGAEIGLTAVQKVALMFESNDKERAEANRKLSQARTRLMQRIEQSFEGQKFDDKAMEREIEVAIQEILPDLIANVVKMAVVAAFTGDETMASNLEKRAAQMEKEIEREVEGRAKALEHRADRLCEQMRAFDQLENSLATRFPNGERLDLITVKR